MKKDGNPAGVTPGEFIERQPADEMVNDSLGTVDLADTTDTDPDDDPEAGGKGIGPKGNEA
jgi:hypothetical protein